MNVFSEVKKNFGFGCMRLPMKDGNVDYDKFNSMIDYFIDNGLVAFCHVRSENQASIELHKKLNCKMFENNVFWF